jgi:hypothetical protein
MGKWTDGTCVLFTATVNGTCACDSSVENVFGGLGYAGDDCSVPCRPCDMGTCRPDGSCQCFPGYSGWRCQDQCNGAGIILFPEFNETYTHTDFDNLPLVPGNANYNQSGLFDVYELYGVSQTPTNDTWAYCACGYRRNAVSDEVEPIPFNELPFNAENGQGYTGPFCDVPCDPCLSTNGKCEYDGTRGVCDCFKDAPNSKGSESKLVQEGTKGYGEFNTLVVVVVWAIELTSCSIYCLQDLSVLRAFIRASRASTGRARPNPVPTGSACVPRDSPIPRV